MHKAQNLVTPSLFRPTTLTLFDQSLKGNFVKIQDMRFKLILPVEVLFVIIIPTSCYIRFH